MNVYWPLPKEKLKKRYQKVLQACTKSCNSTFIGIPHSAKSGYLRFLLQEKDLLNDITHKTNIHFIDPISGQSTLQAISEAFGVTETDQDIIEFLGKDTKAILILYRPMYWVKLEDDYFEEFRNLYEKIRQAELDVSYLLLARETNPFQRYNTAFTRFFRNQFQEFIDYFPVLDQEECDYTVRRLAKMKDKTLLRDYQSLYRLTGGIYPILKIAIMQFSDKYKDCEELYSNNQVQSCLESIIDIVSEDSTNMIQDDFVNLGLLREDGKFKSEWLTRALNERAPSDLTRHEKKVLQLLKDFREDIVSREDIAKCMWGPNYLDRYSEWAIDKIISRIRKKLEAGDSELSIITYKGEGYGIR